MTLDKYISHYDIFEIAEIRKKAGTFDKILNECFEEILDDKKSTAQTHRKIIESIDWLKKAYGEKYSRFYSDTYISIMREVTER